MSRLPPMHMAIKPAERLRFPASPTHKLVISGNHAITPAERLRFSDADAIGGCRGGNRAITPAERLRFSDVMSTSDVMASADRDHACGEASFLRPCVERDRAPSVRVRDHACGEASFLRLQQRRRPRLASHAITPGDWGG